MWNPKWEQPKTLQLSSQAFQIYKYIQREAYGIGEDHSMPGARRIVLELVKSGAVKNLFLELLPHMKHIITTATNLLGQNSEAEALDHLKLIDFQIYFKNQIPFSSIILEALKKNVNVHCESKWANAGDTGGVFSKRNKEIAQIIKDKTATTKNGYGARGCLLLFGSQHFTHCSNSISHFYPDLYHIDLSKL